MIPAIVGRKLGMTRVFDDSGRLIPVTVVQAGPCVVTQVRDQQRDGYAAIQMGFEDVKPHRSTLALIGHALKAQTTPKRVLREIRLQEAADHAAGDVLTVDLFSESEVKFVDVVGTSKGRGFAGVMKRHGFGGMRASHGVKRRHRTPGSISSHASDLGGGGNLKKGKRMAGHMGHARVTVKSQRLVAVDTERNLLLIEGGVPGPNGGVVFVRKAKTRS